jgi:DNA-binding Lrp family transcriptional regulator
MSEQNKPQIHWLQLNNRKRPEFVEIKDSEFIKSGEKNDFPYYLIDLYRRCSFHSAIINAKVNYIAGAGWDYAKGAYMTVAQKSLADKLIRQPFADTDLNESTLRWALDFEVHNMFAILVKWSKNKRTATLEHIDVANLRTNADMSKFAYTRKWYIIKQGKRIENKNFEKEPDYKVYDGYDPNEREGEQIYFYAAYHPDQYVYALPQYRGALTWIENHIAYSDFQYTNITASFAPMINAKFFGNIPDDEKQQEITESFTKNFTSPEGKRLMVGFYQSIEQAAAIDPINVPDQSTLYKEIADQSEYNILASHEFPKLLLGISTEGALGQRNELATMEESYYNRYVISRQRCLEYAINEIVDDIGLPITLKLKRVKSVDWMPSDATIERILGDERLTEYVIDRLGVKNKQSYAFNKATIDANIAVFMKYGVDANQYEVLNERDVLSFDADEIATSEQEFMTFAKAEIKSLDRVVLDLLSKDPFIPAENIAKVAKVSIGDVKDTIDRLRENKSIKWSPEKIAGDKVGAYELTDKGQELIKEQPAKTENLKVMYRYDLSANAPKLVAGGKSRPFCVELMRLNKLYSREDINQMSIEEDRNVWSLRGGWYTNPNTGVAQPQCRHTFRQVIVRERN